MGDVALIGKSTKRGGIEMAGCGDVYYISVSTPSPWMWDALLT